MICERRIDDFEGSNREYIGYLETQVHLARRQLELVRPPTPPKSPVRQSVVSPENSSVADLRTAHKCPEAQTTPDGKINGTQFTFVADAIPQTFVKEKASNQNPAWHAELNVMLTDIPLAALWKERRVKAEMSSSVQNHSVLTTLLGGSLNFNSLADYATHIRSPSSDLEILFNHAGVYGHATREAQKLAQFATTIGVFQELIFVSLCVVLEGSGTPKDSIDTLMRLCFKANTPKSLERIRRGARWANRCIVNLSRGDWGVRSTEIFLLCGRCVPVYSRFSDSTNKSLNCFTGRLSLSQYTAVHKEEHDWLPYHIPCIIKVFLGDALKLQQICDCLGYPVAFIETYANLCERYKRCISGESEEAIIRTLRLRPKKLRSSDRGRISKRRTGLQRAIRTRSEITPEIIVAELAKQTEQQNDSDWLRQSPSLPENPQDASLTCDDLDRRSARSQTSGPATSHQCDILYPDGSGTYTEQNPNFCVVSSQTVPQGSDGHMHPDQSDQSPESTAEALTEFASCSPRGLETIYRGEMLVPFDQQQATDQMMPLSEFDSLWRSSVNMDDLVTFDDLWACSQIFDDPAIPADSTTIDPTLPEQRDSNIPVPPSQPLSSEDTTLSS